MSEFHQVFDNQTILVVGGAGFVGSNLVKLLLKETPELNIHVIDNLLSAEKLNLPKDERVHFTEGSISDDRVLSQLEDRYDYIFHLATYHGNQSSMHDPLADHENNTLTTLKLFERVKNFSKLKKLVYSGAGCAVAKKTYNTAESTVEADVVSLDMDSPYSISKIMGEFYAKYYHKEHSLKVVRARFQNVYGPGEVLGAGQWRGTPATVWRNVTPTFIYKALKGESLPLENGGETSRDFIFVEDIVRGLLYCAMNGEAGDVYNLATGQEVKIRTLAEIINRMTENSRQPSIKPRRTWDNSGCRFGCPEKAKTKLGFVTKVGVEEGLRQTVIWTKENLPFIERMIEKHSEHLSVLK